MSVVRKKNLIEQRNRIVAQTRTILDKAAEEGRGLTAEENTNYQTGMADQESLRVLLENLERQEALDAELASTRGTQLGGGAGGEPGDRGQGGGEQRGRNAPGMIGEGRYAIRRPEAGGENAAIAEQRSSDAYAQRFGREFRASLDATSTGQGGSYLTTPIQIAQSILQRIDDQVFMRSQATVYPQITAQSLGVITLETDAEDSDWTAELATGGEEDSIAFGRRELRPHPLAKRAKISNTLLRNANIDPMGILLDRLAYKRSLTEEKAYLLGNGIQQALGVFFPSVDGIPTSRDIATGNESTNVTFNGLINAKYGLKSGYLRNAQWMFHRLGIAKVALLRDDSGAGAGTGSYLWQPSVQVGQPDKLLGLPVQMSEHVPNTFTTGQYVGILGDFKFYAIVDALSMVIQRLSELYAEKNQTGVILRSETDGQPMMAEAFVRVKLA